MAEGGTQVQAASLQRFIYSEFFKAALMPLGVILLVLLTVYFLVTSYSQREAIRVLQVEVTANMQKMAVDMSISVAQRLRNVATLTSLLQRQTQHLFASQARYPLNGSTEVFDLASNGVFYKKNNDGGSSVYYSTVAKVGAVEKRKAIMTSALDQIFRHTYEANHDLVAVYLNTHDSMNRYYPFIDNVFEQLPPDMNIPDFNFYYLADARHNPSREPVWTEAYLDPAGKGWMMSCIAPVYSGDFLEGVVGLDITINNFVEVLTGSRYGSEVDPFLVDDNGTIMVMPEQASRILKLKELQEAVYDDAVRKDTFKPVEFNILRIKNLKADVDLKEFFSRSRGVTTIYTEDGEYILSQASAGGAGWKLMLLADKKRMLSPLVRLQKSAYDIGIAAAILTLIFCVGFLVYLRWITRRMAWTIASPIQEVTGASRQILAGEYQIGVRSSGIAELDGLAGNFRLMASSLERLHVDLKDSNDKLEDYNQNLQRMVDERTMDLSLANEKLLAEIHQREVTNKRVEEQVLFIQMLIDTIPNPIFCKGLDLSYTLCNKAFEAFSGRKREEIIGRKVEDIMDEEFTALTAKVDLSLMTNPASQISEFEIEIPERGFCTVMIHKASFVDSAGNPTGIVGVITDVTDFKRAEEAARENEEILRLILDGIKAGIIVLDPRTSHVLDLNVNAEKILAGPKADFLGRGYGDLGWQDEDGRPIGDDFPALIGETFREFRIKRPDGSVVPVIKTTLAVTHAGKMLLYVIIMDMSERKALERRLTHSQKLESIGQLAAGIAHEINTPIQYVGDNLYFLNSAFVDLTGMIKAMNAIAKNCAECARADSLRSSVEPGKLEFLTEEVPNALRQAQEGVDRVATIVRAMKKFSHMGGDQKSVMDVNAAVESTVVIAKNEWKYVSEVITELDPDLPSVYCVPGDINQVLLNIVVNAAHAIADVFKKTQELGRITISTRQDDGHVEIRVADTGTGIPEASRDKVFDPFFTTKEVGKGTGQGLAIAYDVIVSKHKGSLTFETEVGKGTTFIIRLPIDEAPAASGSAK